MRRRGNDKRIKLLGTIAIVVLSALLCVLLYVEQKNEEKQYAYREQINRELEAQRKAEEDQYSMRLLCGTTWDDDSLGASFDVVIDTEELIDAAHTYSAVYNNAKITWDIKPDVETPASEYAWRFAVATATKEMTLGVSNGTNYSEYTIHPDKTLFYFPVADNYRLWLELEGGKEEFEDVFIYDAQLVRVPEESVLEAGQYMTTQSAKSVIAYMSETDHSTLSSNEYTLQSEFKSLDSPSLVKIEEDKILVNFEWEFDGVDTDQESVLIAFSASTTQSGGKMKLRFNESYEAIRYLTTQTQEYVFPLKDIGKISSLSAVVELSYGDVFKIHHGRIYSTSGSEAKSLPGGSYLQDEYEDIVLNSEEDALPSMMDGISDGKYLYSINSGKLLVYDISINPIAPEMISSLDGLGNVREITFVKDGAAVAISARENGVWFVDITNPSEPSIASHYDSLELATGIYGYGNYVAICSRYWGVEIVDVSDINNPAFCSSVSNRKEYYDCCIAGSYLFVSAWAQKCVEVYDLSNVYDPKFIVTIALDGNGGGITVRDGIMYVATGYNGQGEATRTNVYEPSFGTGNGLEIYDVSDPKNCFWLSTSKIDGRYYISGFDHWNVSLSGDKAYFSSVSNGVYVFNISNPAAPIRKQHISIGIPSSSDHYRALSNAYILPDGSNGAGKEIITNVLPLDGQLYIMGSLEGTYIYPDADAKIEVDQTSALGAKQTRNKNISSKNYEVFQYTAGTSVYAAVTAPDGKIYVACGRSGIAVLNDTFEEQYIVKTEGEAKDLIINNGYLYSAEGEHGLAVYSIGPNNLVEVGRCYADFAGATFSTIMLCGDKMHVIAQAGFSKVCTVDVSNPEDPTVSDLKSVGSMYSRNLCIGNVTTDSVGELSAVFSSGTIDWYDSYGNLYASMTNKLTGESDGAAAIGNQVVALKDQGYVYYDPTQVTEDALSSLPVVKIDGVILRGKPIIYDDLMVVSYGYGHTIFLVDISDIDTPSLIESIEVVGNPDVAEITEDYILVPLRNEGLLMLKNKES